ncbi:hypothetical protein F5890DRAFT_1560630 [Lentinula detonsa]|uniref:Uncharacterized protein n=1 Tax=Lentinula detonsa TaxID=2804962 RepID=A0AA38ULJ8_9AGAR|nr:hypothetical protein F5890DRAFT_1560630 [Lentinula detonsa]
MDYINDSTLLCLIASNFIAALHVAKTLVITITLNISHCLALSRIIFARTPRTERSKGIANSFAASYPALLGDQAST